MQTQDTTNRSYTVTATNYPESFEHRKQLPTWDSAKRYMNQFIKEQPMSILLTTKDQVVKAYNYKQRVSF